MCEAITFPSSRLREIEVGVNVEVRRRGCYNFFSRASAQSAVNLGLHPRALGRVYLFIVLYILVYYIYYTYIHLGAVSV